MRIILMGPPGSGKSVISRKIAEKYRFPVISMEEVAEELSAMAGKEDEEGRLARDAIAMGRVSDEVCNLVLKRVLSRDELASGYVLPGSLLYTSDAADETDSVNLGGSRINKHKKSHPQPTDHNTALLYICLVTNTIAIILVLITCV